MEMPTGKLLVVGGWWWLVVVGVAVVAVALVAVAYAFFLTPPLSLSSQLPTMKLELIKTFDAHLAHARVPSIQSLSIMQTTLLLGTRGSEILQLDMTNGTVHNNKPLVTGHSFGEVWGLATHPLNNSMFATSGDDKTVRMWHISSGTSSGGSSSSSTATPSSFHECIAVTEPGALPDMSRALVFEPTTGDWLVAGLGGRLGLRKIGTFGKHAGSIVSLDATNLNVLGMMKVAKEQIGDMAFTLDGKTLAVASNDNFIYLVNCNGPMDMQVRQRCTGHSSFVTDVSVSIDSKWMMSNDGTVAVGGVVGVLLFGVLVLGICTDSFSLCVFSGAGEILYWNLKNGKREGDIDLFQKVTFSPNTCPLSWETVGCWPVR